MRSRISHSPHALSGEAGFRFAGICAGPGSRFRVERKPLWPIELMRVGALSAADRFPPRIAPNLRRKRLRRAGVAARGGSGICSLALNRGGCSDAGRTTLDALLYRGRRTLRDDARFPARARRRGRRRAREARRLPARFPRRHHSSLDPRGHGRARSARRVSASCRTRRPLLSARSSAVTNMPSRISPTCRPAASSSR